MTQPYDEVIAKLDMAAKVRLLTGAWFGHGLGYGSWHYLAARADASGEELRVTVSVRNTSDRTSREVVQAYFAPAEPQQPVRLAGWASAEVAAGQVADITVQCDRRMWRRWDTSGGCWDNLTDTGELLIARGLGDVRLRLSLSQARAGIDSR